MDQREKQELVEIFSSYLDNITEAEKTEQIIDSGPDLFSFHSELAGLKNEVRIESRQFKKALDDFRLAFSALDNSNQEMSSHLAELQEEKKALSKATLRPIIIELLEIYDRISAAVQSGSPPHTPLFSKFCKRENEWIKASIEGQKITLYRLTELLNHYGVEPIETDKQKFNPTLMKAASKVYKQEQQEGIVINQLRTGFTWSKEILRVAEVVINSKKGAR
jgi:molecular chaperone GrpE